MDTIDWKSEERLAGAALMQEVQVEECKWRVGHINPQETSQNERKWRRNGTWRRNG